MKLHKLLLAAAATVGLASFTIIGCGGDDDNKVKCGDGGCVDAASDGASDATTDAIDTLLTGTGVCRDYAHLVAMLCRAVEVPARVAAVYAPGLSPMDFHLVVETEIDGLWRVWDATRLAPRTALVRIATGRDAADVAFATVISGRALFTGMEITAVVDGDLPVDDHNEPVFLP